MLFRSPNRRRSPGRGSATAPPLLRGDTETLQIDFLYAPAEEGNPHGQYQLGKMYLDGDQWVAVDPVKARYWLVKSADQGFARAKRLLEDL